jgi:T5orf172 domain
MCSEEQCPHDGAEKSVYKKNSKLFGFADSVEKKKKDKYKYKSDTTIDPSVGFYIKRLNCTTEDLVALGTDKLKVVGDGSGLAYGNKTYLTCLCTDCGTYSTYQLASLLKKQIPCLTCLNIRLRKEALEMGLDLLGPSTDGVLARRNYRFIKCGHIRNIATGDIRERSVSCTECREDKIKKDCERLGLELLRFTGKDTIREVKFKDCGHVRELYLHHFADETIKCQLCCDKELAEHVDSFGIDVIEAVPGAKRKIRFRNCQHEKIVGLSNLKSNSVSCGICLTQKLADEATESGLVYLGSLPGKLHRYRAPCGCEVNANPGHIRKGHWKCRPCEKSHYDFPSKIYLYHLVFKDGAEILKLGYARNPQARLLDYKLNSEESFESLIEVEYDKGIDAFNAERVIHKKYKPNVLSKEHARMYLTESGFTECYPISMKDTLLEELRRLNDN